MAGRLRPRDLGARLSIPLIATAVALVAAIQYGWFSSAAAVEIEGEERALQATVWQAIGREFQRYAPLVADLRQFLDAERPGAIEMREFLEREYLLYGPAGASPGLISSVHIVLGSGEGPSYALDPGSGSWVAGERIVIRSAINRPEDGEGPGMAFVEALAFPPPEGVPPPGADGFLFASRQGEDLSSIAIGIDAEGFFEAYLKPAIAAVLPGAEIRWASERARAGGPGRAFNPITALLGISSERSRTFVVPVPTGFGSFYRPGRDRSGLAAIAGDPKEGRADDRDSKSVPGLRFAVVTMSASSAIGSMERRLAMNWLLGTGLLAGLGAALVLSVIQKRKLALARVREREFVASVTHELRTPVTAIRSAADNIRRGIVPGERLASYGEMIHAEALRLGSMVEEVILSSRVEGRSPGPPRLSKLEAPAFLESLRQPLEAIAKAEGVGLSWDFGALPRSFMSDPESLRLVISNLVANSIYHAYPEGSKGDVRVLGKISLPSALRFTVEDDGSGIGKAEAALVFEAFYRGEASRERNEKGTGLGLYIARRKARELGGELSLESPYRRLDGTRRPGCRFVLELPLADEDRPC